MTAREAALTALERCRRDGAWSGSSIDGIIKKYALDRREAALAARLCLGVLQNSLLCDYYIGCYCSTEPKRLEPKLHDILMLGVYQILFLDRIPARAAVNESVALCRKCGMSRASGLANAVLRRIAENKSAGTLPDIPSEGGAEYLSIKYSHPEWLASRIISERGYDFAEAFLACNNRPAPLTIQVNTLKISLEDYRRALLRAGIDFEYDERLSGCFVLSGGNVAELPGFAEGLFYVQDRAARTAAEIAAPEQGMTVLDACSAPGGKSFAAAIRMQGKGNILSCDIHEKKLKLISAGAERLGIDIIKTAVMDARRRDAALENSFDVVIADVPCSGLGVIAKKPEIRGKTEAEISALPAIQRDILDNLSAYVKRDGVLLYSTCTVLRAENEDVVNAFLADDGEFAPEGFNVGGVSEPSGMHCFWPNVDGTDGFFAAKLRRIK